MIKRRNIDVLLELLKLSGRRVVDIGCGDGTLTRAMAADGARVTGIETSAAQLARARAATQVAGETYLEGVAQHLPLPDGSADIVVFFNSLHHVPRELQADALREARRVLVPNGLVYVAEPLPEGTFFELVRPVEDETEVRRHAYQAIKAAAGLGLVEERELLYEHTVKLADFEAFKARVTAFDEARKAVVAAKEAELAAAFRRLGREENGEWQFSQPSRVNLLRRT